MALTKVSGNILDPGINVAGVVTATGFDGPFSGGTDGNFSGNVSIGGTLRVAGVSTFNSNIDFVSTDAGSAAGPELKLFRNSASPADADYLGQLKFAGESDTGVERNYAKITGKILDASNGTEDGILEFSHIKAGSQTITGRWRSDSLQLLNSTNLSVAGSVDVNDTTDSTSKTTGALKVDGGVGIVKNLYVGGNLVVEGTRTEVQSASLEITDKTIGISSTASPSDTTADGAGIVVYGATDKKLTWENSSDSWLTSEHIKVPDNKRIYVGTGTDLSIYHDTNHSYIADTGTGSLRILSNLLHVRNTADNASIAKFTTGAEVKLYFNANEKLATSDTGITVTGEVAASQNYPTIQPTLRLNFAAVKKLDPRITFYRTGPASYVDEYGNVRLVSANTPRFDHDPVTRESKGLLIEPNVANWIKYGTDLNQNGSNSVDWGLNGTTHTLASSVVGPDGKTGGVWEQKETSSNAYHASYYSGSIPVTSGQYYTISCWVKKGPNYRTDINSGRYQFYCTRGTGSVASISIDSTFTSIAAHSNTTSRSITQYPNGWVRVTYTFQSNQNSSNVQPHWLLGNGGSYSGNGASSVYIWGCQFEQLIYPTTYVPTNGAIVYRGQDDCVIDGDEFSDFYNTEESSLYVEGNIHVPTSYSGQYNIIHIGDNNNDGHGIFRENGTKDVWYHLRSGNSTPSGGNLNPSGFGDWGDGQSEAKIAIAFKSGDQAISVNGGNQVTATVSSGYPSSNISKMWIGSSGQGSNNFSGTISRITYYPKQLTDSQLNTLTS